MRPIATLLDRNRMLDPTGLSEELKLLYDGGLRFPAPRNQPNVIGNFVSTLAGVVSFEIPGKFGGGDIRGFNEADRFIMGLLRASADAIVVGARTLREVASEHLWLAEHIYPEARQQYARYRQRELNKPGPPLNVIVSGSGAVDLQKAVFRTPGLRTPILISADGRKFLESNGVAALASTEVRQWKALKANLLPRRSCNSSAINSA